VYLSVYALTHIYSHTAGPSGASTKTTRRGEEGLAVTGAEARTYIGRDRSRSRDDIDIYKLL
jgi:hypothetical protein